ncbi:hypothetical protein KBP53_00470 [Corynebacterium genitalium ATCC 33030]|uniref:hypothetical protein n=1 Tax=Corynebacterium genitalium TaxID=38288 RepID=UPI0012E9AE63|nr:hypothetical protein [Corynebacterium genitalium]UUA89506.1 hypothetical protein KBP53_00470 [Corynebacterium genitalium ATCC 33030]
MKRFFAAAATRVARAVSTAGVASATCVVGAAFVVAPLPPAAAVDVLPGDPGERTDLVVMHDDGRWTGSPGAQDPRPALSLAKLYLGYWVLLEGKPEDQGKVLRMIRTSSDAVAGELDAAYPEAINEVAELFELTNTYSGGFWGRSSTSPYDLARFITAIIDDPVAEPIIRGMANHAPFAEDGFKQDFGTDQMAGVIGSKFGWSDDRSGAFGSVSFGPSWVIAAMSYGDVDEHTNDVHDWIDQSEDDLIFNLDHEEAEERGLTDGTDRLQVWLSDYGRSEPVPAIRPIIPEDDTDGRDTEDADDRDADD